MKTIEEAKNCLLKEITKHEIDLLRAKARAGAKQSEIDALTHKIDCKRSMIDAVYELGRNLDRCRAQLVKAHNQIRECNEYNGGYISHD